MSECVCRSELNLTKLFGAKSQASGRCEEKVERKLKRINQ